MCKWKLIFKNIYLSYNQPYTNVPWTEEKNPSTGGTGGFGVLNQAGLETNKETHVMIL